MPEYTGFGLDKANLPPEPNQIQLIGRVQENHSSGDLLCRLPEHDPKQRPNFCPRSTLEKPSFQKPQREV